MSRALAWADSHDVPRNRAGSGGDYAVRLGGTSTNAATPPTRVSRRGADTRPHGFSPQRSGTPSELLTEAQDRCLCAGVPCRELRALPLSRSSDRPSDQSTARPALDPHRVMESDPHLIERCLANDQDAWAKLVTRYRRLVYSIPRRYELSTQASDDVFQSVFAALLTNLHAVRDGQTLPKWLMTTTHRECWRVTRQARRSISLPEHQGRSMTEPDALPEHDLLRWEQQHRVHLGLERLGGSCEQLLRAIFLDRAGVSSYAEIARRLKMPVGSIGPTRARCLSKLAEIMKEDGP